MKEQMKRTILPKQTKNLQDIQNPAHLTEYQHPRALLLDSREELVQDDHLARVVDQVLVGRVRSAGFLRHDISPQ
jgi:hypothetical protein